MSIVISIIKVLYDIIHILGILAIFKKNMCDKMWHNIARQMPCTVTKFVKNNVIKVYLPCQLSVIFNEDVFIQ